MEAITKNPSAQRESPILPRASSASAGAIPRSAKYAQRSGIGPEQALKAITKAPRAQRESSILPRAFLRAQDRSRGPELVKALRVLGYTMDRQIGSHIRVTTSSCERIRDATPFLPTVSFRFRQVWRTAEFARPAHFCGPGRDRLRSWSEYLLRRRMDFGSHGPQDLAGENRGIRADCFFSRARFFRPHHARTGRPFQRFVESATVASVNPAPNIPG